MKTKVAVIIPVFNAGKYVAALARSLEVAYPKAQPNLRFVFTDDGSTEKDVSALYDSYRFFKRTDVHVIRNKKNIGYTRNVNLAISKTAKNEDIVLLNSDTEVSAGLFENLQKIALANPMCASVTPTTNLGTIASLFNWPNGMHMNGPISTTDINEAMKSNGSELKAIQIPTPVGFCMYMPKDVILQVGYFDELKFPRGYGEENDWACRATSFGLRHYLAVGIFVKHASGKSFKETKNALITDALVRLSKDHPTYQRSVMEHVQFDPWEEDRWNLSLKISRAQRLKRGRKLIAFVLHNDPEHVGGGVESTVKNLSKKHIENDYDVIQVFKARDALNIRYLSSDDFDWHVRITRGKGDVVQRLSQIFEDLEVLHVHHLLGLGQELVTYLAQLRGPLKKITLHDYWTVCPAIKLVDSNQNYCGIPKEKDACNKCLVKKFPHERYDIKMFRSSTLSILRCFDKVEVPSNEAKALLEKGFENFPLFNQIELQVVPNEITWSTVSRSRKSSFSKRIIFLGAFSPEKGGDLIDSVLPKLKSLGFDPEIWGVPGVIKHSPLTVTSFKDATELETLRSRAEGAIVCTPSLWPETFSYTFYEAIGILKTPVVVGPFGHPAKVTRDQKLGTVMKDRSANALVDAILACAKDYSKIQGRVFDTVLTENVISRQ